MISDIPDRKKGAETDIWPLFLLIAIEAISIRLDFLQLITALSNWFYPSVN